MPRLRDSEAVKHVLRPNPAAAGARGGKTLQLGLIGSLLCYLAHPPAGAALLAWIGPTPWLLLARARRLPGRRPYVALWLAGTAFWVAAIQWLRLAHPANHFGLVVIAAYLGAYLPAFIALVRVAVHRLGTPLWLAAPIVWTGFEWLRARLFTGFLMASLAHTQVEYTWVIQIADLAGEFAVTFLVVLVAASIASALPLEWFGLNDGDNRLMERPRALRHALQSLLPGAVALVASIAYGVSALGRDAGRPSRSPTHRLAIVQSDMLCDWKGSPERDERVMQEQRDLSMQAVRDSAKPIDLIVWPETMFRQPLVMLDEENPPSAKLVGESTLAAAQADLAAIVRVTGAALLVGIDRLVAVADKPRNGKPTYRLVGYNSSAFVDRDARLKGTYDKMHLLPFGEYIPLVRWLPFLRRYSPIAGLSASGSGPAGFELDGVVYSPNICYETVLPQLIRRQFVALINRDQTPDVLVNLTNDSWYWGSSELDMHLASGIFRAVEMRTPLAVAANRGLSAHIDHLGRVAAVTQRDRADALIVDVRLPPRDGKYPSLYAHWGDWLPLSCLVCCAVLALVGLRRASG